jgi:hypothetical protein
MAMMGISLRAYARMRGCSLPAVQKAIASKRITTLPDGSIDPERANQEWARNTFAGQTVNRTAAAAPKERVSPMPEQPTATGDPVAQYLRARAVKTSFEARTAQLEYEERAGKLIQAVRASEYAASFSAIVKDHLQARADRLALMLAAVNDEKAIHRLLKNDDEAVLRKVSKAIADAGL